MRVPSQFCSIWLAGISMWIYDLCEANVGCGEKGTADLMSTWLHPLCGWRTTLCCRYWLPMDGGGGIKVSIVIQGWIYQQLRSGETTNVSGYLLIWTPNAFQSLIQGFDFFNLRLELYLYGQSKCPSSHCCKLKQSMYSCLSYNSLRKNAVFKALEDSSS